MGLRKWAQSNEFDWKKKKVTPSNQYNPFNPFKFNWIKSFGLSWVCPPYPTLLNPAGELNKINVWALTAQQLYFLSTIEFFFQPNYWIFLLAQILPNSYATAELNSTAELHQPYWIGLFQSKCRTKLFTSPASMTSSPLLLL